MNTFREAYYRTYSVRCCSWGNCFCILSFYLIIAIPFYFSFGGSNFWLKDNFRSMDVAYNYTGYYAIQLIDTNGGTIKQTTNILGATFTAGTPAGFAISVNDQSSSLSASISGTGAATVINVILFYDVIVKNLKKTVSTALTFSVDGSASVTGMVSFQANKPVSGLSSQQYLTTPLYFPYLAGPSSFDQLSDYGLTESQFWLRKDVQVDETSSASGFSVTMQLLKNTKPQLSYYPEILETLKFSLSTYLAFAILTYFFYRSMLVSYAEQGAIHCHTHDELT